MTTTAIDGTAIAIENPVYTATGLIDCQIQHPVYGWIPFTCDPNDTAPYSKEIHDRALAMGPAAYVAPTPVEGDYSTAVEAYIDQQAQAKNYADGNSCVSYVGDTVNTQWAAEAAVFKAWRSQIWVYVFQQLALVQSGSRTPQPSVAQILTEVGAIPLTWPS